MNVMNSSGYALSAQDDRAISALLVSYGCAIDRRDWEKLRACFSDDCECDYGTFGKWTGPAAIAQYMKQAHAEVGSTLHRITNIEIEMRGGQVHARSYVDALLMPVNAGGPVHRGIGYYDDQLIRTGAGWRIARRRFTSVSLG
ncbi:MAG: hypothetical protein RLZZ58_1370 [Pseudomonadota bacterium]